LRLAARWQATGLRTGRSRAWSHDQPAQHICRHRRPGLMINHTNKQGEDNETSRAILHTFRQPAQQPAGRRVASKCHHMRTRSCAVVAAKERANKISGRQLWTHRRGGRKKTRTQSSRRAFCRRR
jgi:hypothetical protein